MHTLVWFIWAFALMAIALSTRNPFYLALLLLAAGMVRERVRAPGRSGLPLARFALVAIPLSAALNASSVHYGDTVLFTISGDLPVFSGPVTLEALTYGATNGLMLTTVLSAFSVLGLAVAPHEWMRLAPRAYQSVGMTMSIALSFAPQVARRLREVREAQAIRGHRVRGVRDWLPLWLPLLTSSLEQAMQLSEAMVARGFGAAQSNEQSARSQAMLLVGLTLVLVGWLAQTVLVGPPWAGLALIAGGIGSSVAALRRNAGRSRHTTYREQRWHVRDLATAAALAGACGIILITNALGALPSLTYYPYPTFHAPDFEPWAGALLLVFVAPALGVYAPLKECSA